MWQAGPLVVLGLACYFLSLFLDNLWRSASDLLWLAPDGLPEHDFAVRFYTLSAQIMRAVYATVAAVVVSALIQIVPCRSFTWGGVILGAVVFWWTAIAEWGSVVEYTLCKVIKDQYTIENLRLLWELEGHSSACERYGGTGADLILPIFTTVVIVWILWRAWQIWRNQTPKPTDG